MFLMEYFGVSVYFKKNKDSITLDMIAHWVCVLPSPSCKVIIFHQCVF